MNLAQAIALGLIAQAIPDRRRAAPARGASVPNVTVHEARLASAPFDYSVDAQRVRRRRRRR